GDGSMKRRLRCVESIILLAILTALYPHFDAAPRGQLERIYDFIFVPNLQAGNSYWRHIEVQSGVRSLGPLCEVNQQHHGAANRIDPIAFSQLCNPLQWLYISAARREPGCT